MITNIKQNGKFKINDEILFTIIFITAILIIAKLLYSPNIENVKNGRLDLSNITFDENKKIKLDGYWEFYWSESIDSNNKVTEKLLTTPAYVRIPGSWISLSSINTVYPKQEKATYRLFLKLPSNIENPAINLRAFSSDYKLFINGIPITSTYPFVNNYYGYNNHIKQYVVDLPKEEEVEIIIQITNSKFSRGGIRDSLWFGSKMNLYNQIFTSLSMQLIFIGTLFGFGIYYLILFVLCRNKTALISSVLSFVTILRCSVLGELPILILFPDITIQAALFVNYLTEYNLVPIVILLIANMYKLDCNKKTLKYILSLTLFFNLLLFYPDRYAVLFNMYHFILEFIQICYVINILLKSVVNKRNNAKLMLIVISFFSLTIYSDFLNYRLMGTVSISTLFILGNYSILVALFYIQTKHLVDTNKKLVTYNQTLIEQDKLKNKIVETETAFLQAQIKPHFLYNALNTIANICEKDGLKASNLIVDLSKYLRRSLEFNTLLNLSTIEKELEFVKTYFNIEQARFGKKIQLVENIEVPLEFEMPVLILQPLVENAVRHGITKKIEGGTVYVNIKQTDEGVLFEIEDDGIGIEEKKLVSILEGDRKGLGIGLININTRLFRCYNKGLKIESKPGYKTIVSLLIPKQGGNHA